MTRVDTTLRLRYARYGEELRNSLHAVYGDETERVYDLVVRIINRAYRERSADLKALDEARLLQPDWLQLPERVGYVAYTDRFAGTLKGLEARVDYLSDLGVTYLHLMPLLEPRPDENDGGYAVMNYNKVRSDLGTMEDLSNLAAALRSRGIALVADLVLNHVAAEHEWAQKARAGEQHYRDYFWMFPDRTMPDKYEQHLPEIFPDFAPGNFTWDEQAKAWVWTTFNSYQWDVNWSNPNVFCEYLSIIFNLLNHGVEVIRLDAIAFIWKRLGTMCQGEEEVHHLTQALRTAIRIAAPGAAFKAEAIVGPEQLLPYLGKGEHWGKVSDLAYHNSFMVQLWSSLASRDTRLFENALRAFPAKPSNTTWGAYIRCHDDIGWAISDADAAHTGLSGPEHRRFLSQFYSGIYPGSFARGLVFQYNPVTDDRRISGSLASLAGLEIALEKGEADEIDLALRRITMLLTAVVGFSGVPLLYMGDEIGMLNDYTYADDPDHAADNRWVHRPVMDWDAADRARKDPSSPGGRIYAALQHVIGARRSLPHMHASIESTVVPSPHQHLLILLRDHPQGRMVQVYNLSEHRTSLSAEVLRAHLGHSAWEALSGYDYNLDVHELTLEPYQALWFVAH